MSSAEIPGLPTLAPDSTMARAYLLMQKYNCDTLPVGSENQIVGVISMQDIERLVQNYSSGSRSEALSVGHHMRSSVRPVEADGDLASTIRLMLNESIQAVIVRQNGKVLGILSKDHLLQVLAELSERDPSSLLDTLTGSRVKGP